LAIALWQSGAYEEQLLAAKILAHVARHDPARTLALIHEFSATISDWAVCDTLGMQSVKTIAPRHQPELLDCASRLAKSPMMWQRRLAIVLLTHLAKDPSQGEAILKILNPLRQEREHYIKKALIWIDRDLAIA
jgi:3-methyladenine DNA glycosylase AlkD